MGGSRLVAILYKANETDFNHLGLGPLNDAVSILVTEERNGMFELEMTYPIEGSRFIDLKLDRLIKADAGYDLKNQRFKIIRITKPIDGIVTVNAEHVSYLTQDLALKPTVNYSGNAQTALNTWKNNIVDDNPFIVSSDITTVGSGSWSIKDVKNAREALGGVSGSILETYGGEYRFDNYSIRLMAQRGVNSGALIAYGRNLVDLTQEESIADTFTSVYPYSVYQDANNEEVLLTLPEYFVDSEYVGNYARRKILPVDFSSDEIKDVATLRSRAASYVESNGVGIPKVNMKIKYIDLAKTLDYKNLAILEEVNLCDNVSIYFEQLGVNTSAKIIKTVWDDLLDQYDSIEVGEAKSSLSNSINATVDGKLETIVQRVNTIQLTADGLNVIHRGPEEPPPGNIGDLWYEPDGIFENMYQWDGSIWKLMLSTRNLDLVAKEVEKHTDEIVAVTESANDAVANSELAIEQSNLLSAKIDLTNSNVDGLSLIVSDKADNTRVDQLATQWTQTTNLANGHTGQIANLGTDINLRVKKDELISQINLQSNNILIQTGKLYLDTASVVFGGNAFIPSAAITSLTADKINTGELNAANVNIINLNVSKIVGLNSNFIQSNWNQNGSDVVINAGGLISQTGNLKTTLNAGQLITTSGTKTGTVNALGMQITDSSNGWTTKLYSDGLEFQWYGVIRGITQTSEGLEIKPTTGSGARLNSALALTTGPGNDKIAYLQLANPDGGTNSRLEMNGTQLSLRHPNGGSLDIADYAYNGQLGRINSGKFRTTTVDGRGIQMEVSQISALAGNQTIYIMPSGSGELRIGNGSANPTLWPVRASQFIQGSSRDSKTNINAYTGNALHELSQLKVVTYNRKDDLARGVDYLSLGFIAEDSPAIAVYNAGMPAGVDQYKMVSLAIKGVQELNQKVVSIDSVLTVTNSIANNAMNKSLQVDAEVQQMKNEISELDEKIKQLESVE